MDQLGTDRQAGINPPANPPDATTNTRARLTTSVEAAMTKRQATVIGIMAMAMGTAPAWSAQPADPPAQVPAQPAADLPTADALIARYVQAIGGEDRYFAQTNRIMEGTSLTDPGGAFALVTMWQAKGNRLRLRTEKPGAPWMDLHYMDDAGWMTDGTGRIALLGGAVIFDLADSADFYNFADPQHRYTELTTTGREAFDDHDTFVVKGSTVYHKDETLYFDAKSGLLIGVRTTQTTADGVKPLTVHIQDYKPFGGILFPTRLIQQTDNGTTTIRFNKIRVNVEDFKPIEMPEVVAKRVEQIRKQEQAEQAEQTPPASDG